MKTNVGRRWRVVVWLGVICLGLSPLSAQEPKLTLKGHTSPVWSVAYSPDGKWLASGSGPTIQFATPHGKTLASGNDSTIKLWDVTDRQGKATLKGHTTGVVPWRSARTARRWPRGAGQDDQTVGRGRRARNRPPSRGTRKPGVFRGVQSGRQDAGLGGDGTTIKLWDVADGQGTGHPPRAHGSSGVWSVAYSPDGKTLASGRQGQDDQAVGRDRPAKEQATLKGHTNLVISVAYSPDGKTLASGSWDNTSNCGTCKRARNDHAQRAH